MTSTHWDETATWIADAVARIPRLLGDKEAILPGDEQPHSETTTDYSYCLRGEGDSCVTLAHAPMAVIRAIRHLSWAT